MSSTKYISLSGSISVSVSHSGVRTLGPATITPNEPAVEPSTKIQDDIQVLANGDAESENEETMSVLNTIDDLTKGKINTRKGKKRITILIVGETGTGKTTFLSLITNVLRGNQPLSYEKVNKVMNESGGRETHTQTNEAVMYSFESNNGVTFNILDTPGFADTRGIGHDERHKQSIVHAIKNDLTTVDAIFILINGTVSRLGAATNYALSTLSSMFPNTLAKNIGLLFTAVSSPLSWGFDEGSLPEALQDNPIYLLNNPVAMQDRYIREKKKMEDKKEANYNLLKTLEASVEEGHIKALGELVRIFDWLDTLSPQPTNDILSLYNQSQAIEKEISDVSTVMEHMSRKRQALRQVEGETDGTNMTIEQYKQYESTITQKVYKQIETPKHNVLCAVPMCYSNCHEGCDLDFSKGLLSCWAFSGPGGAQACRQCNHPHEHHFYYNAKWELCEDVQITIDEVAKKKYDDALVEKARRELMMESLKKSIVDIDAVLANSMANIGHLAEDYAELSLSGGFTDQVQKSVVLLEMNLNTMHSNGADARDIKSIESALDQMQKKLVVIKKAKEQARKNRREDR